jgi:hypothetical protein
MAYMVMNEQEFNRDLDQIGNNIIRYTQKIDLLFQKMPFGATELKEKALLYQKNLMTLADEFEALMKYKNSPEMKDKYFFNMRQLELNQLSKRFQRNMDEFDQLSQEINQFKTVAKPMVKVYGKDPIQIKINPGSTLNPTSNSTFNNSPNMNDDDDEEDDEDDGYEEDGESNRNYAEYLTLFLRSCLEFSCPHCHKVVPFGESTCPKCQNTIVWNYDQQDIFDRLSQIPKKIKLKCPRPSCGARIELDWESCAICELDIQRMLNADPNLN